jgi:transposase
LFTRKGAKWLRGLGLDPVDSILRMMSPLMEEIRLLSLELRHNAAGDEDIRLLTSIPGVGYYTAVLVKAEVSDIDRFHSGDQLASYAGLAPSNHSSGGVTHHGRITKEGSAWLRWAMVEAAHVHFRFDSPVTRAYHRVAERRGKGKAAVAAARMLLLVCRSVLKNWRPYFNPVHGQAC